MRKELVTVRRKNWLLTGRGFNQNQAQRGAAVCCDLLGSERREKRRKEGGSISIRFRTLTGAL